MDYTQPPAYIERISENPAQKCQQILDKLRKGSLGAEKMLKSQFMYPMSIEDRLAAFPPEGLELIQNRESKKQHLDLAYQFYKYPQSRRDWDIALIIDEKGVPMGLYYVKGNRIDKFNMVLPPDVIIYFHKNPLYPLNDDFKIKDLERYVMDAEYMCSNTLSVTLDNVFNSLHSKKEKKKPPKPNKISPKIKKQSFPNQQIFKRPKIPAVI